MRNPCVHLIDQVIERSSLIEVGLIQEVALQAQNLLGPLLPNLNHHFGACSQQLLNDFRIIRNLGHQDLKFVGSPNVLIGNGLLAFFRHKITVINILIHGHFTHFCAAFGFKIGFNYKNGFSGAFHFGIGFSGAFDFSIDIDLRVPLESDRIGHVLDDGNFYGQLFCRVRTFTASLTNPARPPLGNTGF